jgi:hypothetical protein
MTRVCGAKTKAGTPCRPAGRGRASPRHEADGTPDPGPSPVGEDARACAELAERAAQERAGSDG